MSPTEQDHFRSESGCLPTLADHGLDVDMTEDGLPDDHTTWQSTWIRRLGVPHGSTSDLFAIKPARLEGEATTTETLHRRRLHQRTLKVRLSDSRDQ